MKSTTTYYGDEVTSLIERGEPQLISSGDTGDLQTQLTYATAATGGRSIARLIPFARPARTRCSIRSATPSACR